MKVLKVVHPMIALFLLFFTIFTRQEEFSMVSEKLRYHTPVSTVSAVDSGDAGGARAPLEFGSLEKGRRLISTYRSLAITTNTPGFKKAIYGAAVNVYNNHFR